MGSINDFFIPENMVGNISDETYKKAYYVIDTLDAISRLTYQSIYVIDYFKQTFLYVSDNPFFLCGFQPDEVKEMGYNFYFNQVPESEINMLLEINKEGFAFFNKVSIEERMKLLISYDFHIKDNDQKILINHKLTPILLADNGHIWLAACVVSLSSKQNAGHIEAHMDGRSDYWTYSLESHEWQHQDAIMLSKREKEILLYSAQGLTGEQIADKICRTMETVNYHKQNLFNKLGVNNIASAIAIASQKKMI